MQWFPSIRAIVIIGAVALISATAWLAWQTIRHNPTNGLVTTTIERGSVQELIGVSGFLQPSDIAELGFPNSGGTISSVLVTEGDVVQAGTVLATLASASLLAERASAQAAIRVAEADLAELLSGPTDDIRNLNSERVRVAETNLARIESEQRVLVENTRRTFYSSGLAAVTTDPRDEAIPPKITGNYICDEAGVYRLRLYSANSDSGFAFTLSGLESGTYTAFTTQPGKLGNCGLYVQLTAGERYNNTEWEVHIPNQRDTLYVTNLANLTRIEESAQNAISTAQDALVIARKENQVSISPARIEAVNRAKARLEQARARLVQIDAQLSDRSILAPFSGTVTSVRILPGEAATVTPVITLLQTGSYELTARIPEVDITKLEIGQSANVTFDARKSEPQKAKITYIAPLSSQIDGVAYFEAKLSLLDTPNWIRGGLNADIDIIVHEETNTLRIPTLYIRSTEVGNYVQTLQNGQLSTSTIEVVFTGNDGYTSIRGVAEHTTVVAP